MGRLDGSVGSASDLSSGHDLTVCEFEPHATSAQVMISQSVSSSPASGSGLTAQSLGPALDPVSPSLSASPLRVLSFSLSLSQN